MLARLDGLPARDDGPVDLSRVQNRMCEEDQCEAEALDWFHEILPERRHGRGEGIDAILAAARMASWARSNAGSALSNGSSSPWRVADGPVTPSTVFAFSLPQPRLAPDRIDQLRGIEPDALLEHDLDVPHVGDRRRRIAVRRRPDPPACRRRSCRRSRRGRGYFAPFDVPMLMASSGLKPASTSSSSWR